MTTDSKAVCGGGEGMQQLRAAVDALGITDMWLDNNHPWRLMMSRGSWNLALAEQHPDRAPGDGKWADGKAVSDIVNAAIHLCREPAALASTAGAGSWRPMDTAPSNTPIVARHKPNNRTPHGWVATISRAPEDPDERVGGLDTILHYNGDALKRGFHGVWVGWMYPEEFAALALSAGTLSVGWDGARDAFARIVEERAWTAEHGEPRAACLRAASDIRQAKAPAVPASPRSETVWDYTHALQSVIWRICNGHPITDDLIKQAPHAAGMAAKFMAASLPAPAEHGVEIRAFAHAILHGDDEHRDWLNEASEAFIAGNPLPPARGKGTQSSALSQGGGAGRSERALMLDAITQARGALYLDAMKDEAGKPYGTTAVALEALAAAEEALHRSEIAGRSEKREGDALQRLRSAAVKVLSSCNRPHDLDVALDELETVVRATPAAPAQSPSTSDAEG